MLFPAAVIDLLRMDTHGFPDAAGVLHRSGHDPITHKCYLLFEYRPACLPFHSMSPGGFGVRGFGKGANLRRKSPRRRAGEYDARLGQPSYIFISDL